MKVVSANKIARALVTNWVFLYGSLTDLIADNGKKFTSKFFQEVRLVLNVHNAFTMTCNAQALGHVKRFSWTIKSTSSIYIGNHPRECDFYTSAITYAYNTQLQFSTTFAPFDVGLSKQPRPFALHPQTSEPCPPCDFNNKWKAWLDKALDEAKIHLEYS